MTMLDSIRKCLSWIIRYVVVFVSDLVFGFLYGRNPVKLPPITNPLLLASATDLAQKIRSRKVSSVEVVEAFISRINEVNPILNCVVQQRFKKALQEANKVDEYLKSTELSQTDIYKQKPLLGVPFTIKDSFYVKGLKNTCGLYLWRNDVSDKDSDVVMLLKKAGAIPLAQTNVSELCTWHECYNKVYGTTRNPYHTGCIPGGSSGGEGALQASGGSPFSIGSDFGGSVRMPAFFNGIFAHKPSPRIVSNVGQRPERAEFYDFTNTVGPICRYSSDLTTILNVIAEKGRPHVTLQKKVDISSIRYLYMTDAGDTPTLSPVNTEIKQCIIRATQYLENTYQVNTKQENIPEMALLLEIYDAWLHVEGHVPFTQELTGRKGNLNVWIEMIYWLIGRSKHSFPALRFAIQEKSSPERGSPEHTAYNQMRDNMKKKFEDMLGNDGVFIFPTHPLAGIYLYQAGVLPLNFVYTAIFNGLGLPATQCPMGFNKRGMPIGLQIVAGRNQDHVCIAVAAELEKAFGGWKPPCDVKINK